ncbi:MAG: hypothetical protein F6J96_08145 [Symploca sp. SIO1C2]|nr:hypothetical protein [Symploca sp. SIO1C2]
MTQKELSQQLAANSPEVEQLPMELAQAEPSEYQSLKLPLFFTGMGIALASSNFVAISWGLYSLFYVAPSSSGDSLLQIAREQYQEGYFEQAIALAQSIPTDSSAYEESADAILQWRRDWYLAATQFQATEQAFKEGRWRDVLEGAHQTPDIAVWRKKMLPLVLGAIPKLELEAQQLLQQVYQLAAQNDFTGALALIKQIPQETPTGAKLQPKLIEYQRKQQIQAEYLLQQAFNRAQVRDFQGALQYLLQISPDTSAYQKAQVKIAEYQQKQIVKEKVERKAQSMNVVFNQQQSNSKLDNHKSSISSTTEEINSRFNPGFVWQEVII